MPRMRAPRARATRRWGVLPGVLLACSSVSCAGFGARTVPTDRFEYSSSISESWKRQTLLNVVKLRYLDTPIFVDVGQIVAGYSLETALNAGVSLPETDSFGGNTLSLGGSTRFTDRPTVTYAPLTGSRFVRGLMMPIPVDSVFYMIQSGWPADSVLMAAVASINGLQNQEASVDGVTPADPRFLRAAWLLRQIQMSGAVAMRVLQGERDDVQTLLVFRSQDIPEKTLAEARELRELLGLDPDAPEIRLVFGATAADDREVAVVTRSILHVMAAMSVNVEVPAEHVAEGRAIPGLTSGPDGSASSTRACIHSSRTRPSDASVAVAYRDHWFWIDDRDLRTKRAFAFIMFFFTLADTGDREALPMITIPAQ